MFSLLGLAHDSLTCPNQYSQQNQITFWIRSKFYEISRKLFQKSNFIFTLLISFVTLKRRTNYYDANFDNSSKPFANGQKIPTSMTQRESLCKLLLKTCHVIRSLVEFLPSSKEAHHSSLQVKSLHLLVFNTDIFDVHLISNVVTMLDTTSLLLKVTIIVLCYPIIITASMQESLFTQKIIS